MAGRYDNLIPTRFLSPMDCSKVPAQVQLCGSNKNSNCFRLSQAMKPRSCGHWKIVYQKLIITSEHIRVYLNVSHPVKIHKWKFFELLSIPYTYVLYINVLSIHLEKSPNLSKSLPFPLLCWLIFFLTRPLSTPLSTHPFMLSYEPLPIFFPRVSLPPNILNISLYTFLRRRFIYTLFPFFLWSWNET